MDAEFLARLHPQSTVGELPSYAVSLDLSQKGQELADVLQKDPDLPGVVVTADDVVRGVISRGQYLRLVGRYLGLEVYHPRPIRLMFEATEVDDDLLVVPATTQVQAAVRSALSRPRTLVYEPLIISGGRRIDDASLRLVDFQDLLMADARISALRNRQMSQILSTVQEGFLLVDPEHVIAAEYSRSVEDIFATPAIAGRRFEDLLREIVGDERARLGGGYLDTLFNPNVIEKLVTQINPLLRVEATIAGTMKHLAFRFLRSLEGSSIERVMVKVEDVTREVELAAELAVQEERTRERVALVFDILRADAGQLSTFLRDLGTVIQNGETLVRRRERRGLGAYFRSVHGLKGEAGLLDLDLFQGELHALEDRLVSLRDQLSSPATADLYDPTVMTPSLRHLRQLADATRSIIDQFRRLGHLQTQAADGAPERENGANDGDPGLFESVERLVAELSERLGKPARFHTRSSEHDIPPPHRRLLQRILVQLVRNSIVHGLEPLEERQRAGKPLLGSLQFAVRSHDEGPAPGHIEYVFQDDGAGLDLEAIRRRALERGLTVPAPGDRESFAAEADDAVKMLIFASGFSTADETTRDAGRGVGLDLVHAAVDELGGYVVPHSQPGAFCAFQIILPQPEAS
ncbi:MAG: ATP-binding protein [Acidobacteriota bacterium]